MIRSMKRCLKKLLQQSRIDYEQLYTLLVGIQTIEQYFFNFSLWRACRGSASFKLPVMVGKAIKKKSQNVSVLTINI